MRRLVRFGMVCSLAISVALFALAAWAWSEGEHRASTTPGDLLQIDPPQRSLGDIKAGSVVPVSFTLSNRSSRPIRVLGVEFFCTKWGCISLAGLPVTVAPHSKREVQLMLRAARAGDHEFSTAFNLYSDCPGEPAVPVRIQGRVFDGAGQH
jgi:hypothetical protein